MSVADNKARVRRALDDLNRGDLEAYLTLYHPGAVLHGYGLEPGRDPIRQFYLGFLAAFPDTHIALKEVLGEGDLLACRYTFTGTHQGMLNGIPPTGRNVEVNGLTILRFEDGACVERWTQMNDVGLMQQLGALPAPMPA